MLLYCVYYGSTVVKVTWPLSKEPDRFLHPGPLELPLNVLRGPPSHTSSCPRHCPRKEVCHCLLTALAAHLSADSKSQSSHFKSTSSSLVPSASGKQEQLDPHPLEHNPANPQKPSLNHNSPQHRHAHKRQGTFCYKKALQPSKARGLSISKTQIMLGRILVCYAYPSKYKIWILKLPMHSSVLFSYIRT